MDKAAENNKRALDEYWAGKVAGLRKDDKKKNKAMSKKAMAEYIVEVNESEPAEIKRLIRKKKIDLVFDYDLARKADLKGSVNELA